RTTVLAEHQAGAHARNTHAEVLCRERLALPVATQPPEERICRRVGLVDLVVVEVIVARERVVVDAGGGDERLRPHGQPADRLDDRARALDPTVADELLLARVPPLRGDRFAGEVNDRVDAIERVAPRPGRLECGGDELETSARRIARALE